MYLINTLLIFLMVYVRNQYVYCYFEGQINNICLFPFRMSAEAIVA